MSRWLGFTESFNQTCRLVGFTGAAVCLQLLSSWAFANEVAAPANADKGGPSASLPANFNPVVPVKADPVDRSVAGGLDFLMRMQTPEGMIQDCARCGNYSTAMSALAVLSFAAAGHHPMDRTVEGVVARRALDFVLRTDRQSPNGSFGATDKSMLYGHGITTMTLNHLLTMGLDPEKESLIRKRSRMAVDLILLAQKVPKVHNEDMGGWRYTPDSATSDLSISVWQIASLWSARKAGLAVPDSAFTLAANFLGATYANGLFSYEHFDLRQLPSKESLPAKMSCSQRLMLREALERDYHTLTSRDGGAAVLRLVGPT